MKTIGTGIDIIEVKRIKKIIQQNKTFLRRVFSDKEISYCEKKKNKYEHYAVRFAAKEAVLKALGNKNLALKNISVNNLDSGKPEVKLAGNLKKIERDMVISLSHCKDYAVAQAIYYKSASWRKESSKK